MKKIGIIMMFVAMLGATSCSSLTNVSDTAAATTGSSCAKSLVALRSSQKAGTLSVTNTNDLSNMLTVVGAYNALKANKSNSSFKNSFVKGMVTGGSGVINSSNALSIANMLLSANGLSGITNSNIVSNATQTTSAILTILNALQ